jgi:CubicO group peptidase (beta-lactamase class C family)
MTRAIGPSLPAIDRAMQDLVVAGEIAGAVTVVAGRDRLHHCSAVGWADLEAERPATPETIFWIASMTKPLTGIAILMLQEEGKLHIDQLVAEHLPEFSALRTPSGKPANLTIERLLTHTSGLSEVGLPELQAARSLAALIPAYLAEPTSFEPGEKWQYCQSSINTAARIVEVASGMPYQQFLGERLFRPLGMEDTAFSLTQEQADRLSATYELNRTAGRLQRASCVFDSLDMGRAALAHAGLFSTGPDYARLCQVLLNNGTFEGRRYLTAESVAALRADRTGSLPAGFLPGSAWGLATSLVREPQGVTAMLSPGSYGHGGMHGTQAWIDPVKGFAYILMIQRAGLANSDGSSIRESFQRAAFEALEAASER